MVQPTTQLAAEEAIYANISGEVSGQVAVGSYILQIGSVHGGVVNINLPEQKPRLKARPAPVYILPRRFAGLLDRVDEVGAASNALPAFQPVEFYAEGGSGKTSLLRVLARHSLTTAFPDGVIYLSARAQAPADLLQSIFDALFEYDAPYKPSEGEIRFVLQNKRALILLDDVALSREEVEALFDAVPESTFLLASQERKLWGGGLSLALPGLPLHEARRFLERELGRPLTDEERSLGDDLCSALGGHPLALIQAAALVRDQGVSLQSLAALAKEDQPERKIAGVALGMLSLPEQKAVAAIAALGGGSLNVRHIPALTGIPEMAPVVAGLEKRGVIRDGGKGYTLSGSFAGIVMGNWQLGEWRAALLNYFRSWAEHQLSDPHRILDELDGILLLIESASKAGDWQGALNLVRAVEGAAALSRRWGAWEQVLQRGLEAANALGDLKAKAWVLHQLGTRLLALNEKLAARQSLVRALRLREMLGDRAGAAATRHNLSLLLGPPGGDSPDSPKGSPPDSSQPAASLTNRPVGALSTLLMTGLIAVVVWFALQFSPVKPPAVPPPASPIVQATMPPLDTPADLPGTGAEMSPTPSLSPTATLALPTDVPTPTPTDTATPTVTETQASGKAPCVPQVGWPVYTIRPEDTLWSIAQASGSTVRDLTRANCLSGTRINAGQPLLVPRLPVYPPTLTPTPTITPTFTPLPPEPPDLFISSLDVGPASAQRSGEGRVFSAPASVTIANRGGQDAGPFQVEVYLPPFEALIFSLDRLEAGASSTFQGTFVTQDIGGKSALTAWAVADGCPSEGSNAGCQVVESDETNNRSADQPVEVLNEVPVPIITDPYEDVPLDLSGPDKVGWYQDVTLRGEATDLEDGPISGDHLIWSSDLAGELGRGSELNVRLYSDRCEGVTHTITLTAIDTRNAQTTTFRRITLQNESDCRPIIKVEQPQSNTHYVSQNPVYEGEVVTSYYLNIDGIADAYDVLGNTITESLIWSVDGIGQVGSGGRPHFTLYLSNKPDACDEVTYKLYLTIMDADSRQAEQTISITMKECYPVG